MPIRRKLGLLSMSLMWHVAMSCTRAGENQPAKPLPHNSRAAESGARIISGPEMTCLKPLQATPMSRCEMVERDIEKCAETLRRELGVSQQLESNLGALYLNHGREEKAVSHYRRAYDLAKTTGGSFASRALYELGIAQMRWGEAQNCVLNHQPESCVFPISGAARHTDESGSRQAIASFTEYLAMQPNDEKAGWLLNVATQTIGQFPQGVPSKFLVSKSDVKSEMDFPKFRNVAPALGFDKKGLVSGIILDDLNNDGLIDVVTSSVGVCDPVRYYENDGSGKFIDRSNESGLATQLGVNHMVQADFDNDGLLDIYGTRGIWETELNTEDYGTDVYNVLLKNYGGRFSDVTTAMGLKMTPHHNVASAWGDYDNDGYADLFVCSGGVHAAVLYRNDRGKRFHDVSEASGIENVSSCMGTAWGDVNNDGWVDLFIANHGGPNKLYLNSHGKFALDRQPALRAKPVRSFSTFFFDFNNDGWLDLFVSAWDGRFDAIGRVMRKEPTDIETARLFQNIKGKFVDVTARSNIPRAILVMASNFGDLDNDGFPDMYLGTGGPAFEALVPNIMYRNVAGRRFADVTVAGGFGNLQKGHGLGFADLDNDGDQDVMATFGGWFEADRYVPSLYENPGFGNHFLTLRLVGTNSNRSAIGSRVKAIFREQGQRRTTYQTVSSGGSFGSGSLQVEMGIGRAAEIESLEIKWAGSLTKSHFENIPANRILTITEGSAQYEVNNARPFAFAVTSTAARHQHVH